MRSSELIFTELGRLRYFNPYLPNEALLMRTTISFAQLAGSCFTAPSLNVQVTPAPNTLPALLFAIDIGVAKMKMEVITIVINFMFDILSYLPKI